MVSGVGSSNDACLMDCDWTLLHEECNSEGPGSQGWGFPAQMMIIRDLILKYDVTLKQKLMC